MNEFQAWKKFVTTGKIKDYIDYKHVNPNNGFTDVIEGVNSNNAYKDRRGSTQRNDQGQAENTDTFN